MRSGHSMTITACSSISSSSRSTACAALAFVKPVEVDVIQTQAAEVRVDQRERRARDVLFVNPKSRTNSFHEERLARAEWSIE